ncbi:MAG TPA: acetate/propionate family kinase [Pirellulales bacterium]|nr:acetate/propionate family kinase [Pirellulales bacterium]
MDDWILALNGGSSSLKFAVFAPGEPPTRQFSGRIERVGQQASLFTRCATGEASAAQPVEAPDLESAAKILFDRLGKQFDLGRLRGIGHRIVHGGADFTASQSITPAMLDELRRLAPLDPEHLPGEIALVEACQRRLPKVAEIACFDTAFHRDLPREARLLPIPLHFEREGIRRYGFHGLSYSFLMEELARLAGPERARGRVVLAHLGSGASMAAVRDGHCVDTTMAFTPTAGLVMGTRTGDLDPGVFVHLLRQKHMTADAIDELVNRQSGLLGLSETIADVRDLLARRVTDPRARDALSVFSYQARKWIGALAAALGGIDTLVFAGGIGENSVETRAEICRELGHLGIALDNVQNATGQGMISAPDARCQVWVIHTDEESMIAREVQRLLDEPESR